MNVEIGTETPIFLFWEYLFRNFGILSLQCGGATIVQYTLEKCLGYLNNHILRMSDFVFR